MHGQRNIKKNTSTIHEALNYAVIFSLTLLLKF